MILLDLLNDQNQFNRYADDVKLGDLGSIPSKTYDLRSDPARRRPGYRSAGPMAVAYSRDLEEADGFFRAMGDNPIS